MGKVVSNGRGGLRLQSKAEAQANEFRAQATDKYGAVNTAAWQDEINKLEDRTWTETAEDTRRGGYKQVTRRDLAKTRAQQEFNKWNEANKYQQQTFNQQIMAGASKNENIANTSVNELDTAQSDNIDPAVTSVGKKKKTQGSLSTSLGI